MRRSAARLAERAKGSWLVLRSSINRRHEPNRRLVRRCIEIAADNRTIGIVPRANPFQKPAHLILARRIRNFRSDEMRHIEIEQLAGDLEPGHERYAVVRVIIEVRRFDDRITAEQRLALDCRLLTRFALLRQNRSEERRG